MATERESAYSSTQQKGLTNCTGVDLTGSDTDVLPRTNTVMVSDRDTQWGTWFLYLHKNNALTPLLLFFW